MPLRLRRGTNAERLGITPAEGELIYVTDDKKVYVGDGTTVGGVDFAAALNGDLGSDINLNGFDILGTGNINIDGDITGGNITANGFLTNGIITFDSNVVKCDTGYVSPGLGNVIGIIEVSNETNLIQLKRSWKDSNEPLEVQYGISNGFTALITSKYASRGTLSSPDSLISADNISLERYYGHDGFDYVLSSSIWHGVDPTGTPDTGFVPGALALITEGTGGPHIVGLDSLGRFSIGRFPEPASEKLDVNGNALISGTVYASNFVGSVSADDSTLLVDSVNGNIFGNIVSNGILSLVNDSIVSTNTFTSSGESLSVGILELSTETNPLQLKRTWAETTDPLEIQYGVTNGYYSLLTNKYACKGSLSSPQALISSDCISQINNFAFDGVDYTLASTIWCGLDAEQTVYPGFAPGAIAFLMQGPDGLKISGFNSRGYLGLNTTPNPPEEQLDVGGNAKIRGTTYSDEFSGDHYIMNSSVPTNDSATFNGITDLGNCNVTSFYASRGSIASPTAAFMSDAIAVQNYYSYDGSDFILSSQIRFDIDPSGVTPGPGIMPGSIGFIVNGGSGQKIVAIDSEGQLGIGTFPNPIAESLDVYGNAVIRGDGGNTVSALQLPGYNNHGGTGYHDFLTVTNTYSGATNPNKYFRLDQYGTIHIVDSTYSNTIFQVTNDGHAIAKGYVQFGSFTKTERDALPAANGMVVYNTTSNKFQGFQGGAWINLDDGLADP